jgi:hypothetical protein
VRGETHGIAAVQYSKTCTKIPPHLHWICSEGRKSVSVSDIVTTIGKELPEHRDSTLGCGDVCRVWPDLPASSPAPMGPLTMGHPAGSDPLPVFPPPPAV